jgi:adenylate cyclase
VLDPAQANVAGVPDWIRATAYRVRTGEIGPDATSLLAPVGLLVPAPRFAAAGVSSGHVSLILEADGSLRADLPAVEYDGDLFPSLAVEAARLHLRVPRERVAVQGSRGIQLGDRFVPTDAGRRQLINHYGPDGTIPTLSLIDLLRDRMPPTSLAGRIVVVGASAAGAGDRFATPFTSRLPGSEFLATAVDNILESRSLVRNGPTRALDMLAIVAMALAAALLAGRRSPIVSLLAVTSVLAVWAGVIQAAFVLAQVWLAALAPSAAALVAGVGVEGLRLTDERRRRRGLERQRANLARYFAPAVVERLAASDAPARLDRTQEAAVLFVDIVGFTRLGESMTPAAAMELLRRFHTRVEQAVFAHGGMVDKFMGDGAMACFGVPDESATAAADAIRAALTLLAALDEPIERGAARLTVGVGIHCGPVLMGDIGGSTQFQFTVIGDTVNVASRLESLTRQQGTSLIVSDVALAAARSHLEPDVLARFEPLPDLKLRGRDGTIGGWRLAAMADGTGAGEGIRTLDPNLGKVVLYP